MSRFIWGFAGLSMAFRSFIDMVEGPQEPMAWVDPAAWTIVFGLGALAWFYLAVEAARGRF